MVTASSPPSDMRASGHKTAWRAVSLLVAFVVVWTFYGAVAGASGSIHHDTAEAYVWGREFQLGYYKHPPFWAWIAGAWFSFAPHQTWAFCLLSVINAAIGLWGSWALVGNFEQGKMRAASVFLLLLTPCFTFLAFKFNANTIFLSLWPWTLHFFVRSFRSHRAGDAMSFGVFMALALLSKYFAVLLGVACFLAAVAHPKGRPYFASAAPYLSVVTVLVFLSPHIWWLTQTGFLPFHYFDAETGRLVAPIMEHAAGTLGAFATWQVVVVALIASCAAKPIGAWRASIAELWRAPDARMLAILALAPALITVFVALIFRNKVSNNMLVGTISLVPLLLVKIAAPDTRLLRRSVGAAIAVSLAAVAASPLVAYASIRFSEEPAFSDPREEATRLIEQRWLALAHAPLRFISGSHHYADAAAFYGSDHPHVFIDFSFREAPWVERTALARDGLAVICVSDDGACLAAARRWSTPQTRESAVQLAHAFGGFSRRPVQLTIFLTPPRAE